MKLTALLTLPLLVTAALASTAVLAADGGPQTGGHSSTNPNGRPPRSESATADGGPLSGDASSTNPNSSSAPATAAPPTAPPSVTTTTTAPPSATISPITSAPVGPPMSGGNSSTNPIRRTRTPSPSATTSAPPTTTPPLTTMPPPPRSSSGSDNQHVNVHTNTKSPASKSPSSETIDFSLINGDTKSGASDIIGEVSAEKIEDDSTTEHAAPLPDSSKNTTSNTTIDDDGTAKEAEGHGSTSGFAAATPSPVSKKTNVSNAQGVSGSARSGYPSVASVVVAIAASMVLMAAGF